MENYLKSIVVLSAQSFRRSAAGICGLYIGGCLSSFFTAPIASSGWHTCISWSAKRWQP